MAIDSSLMLANEKVTVALFYEHLSRIETSLWFMENLIVIT